MTTKKYEKELRDLQVELCWLEVSNDEQKRRFEARVKDPLRQWKLSPTDLPSRKRCYDYSRARDIMLSRTDKRSAPSVKGRQFVRERY